MTDQIDSGQVLEILEFYFGGENKNFLEKINNLKPNQETAFFIEFLMTDLGSQLMKENNLSIHIQTGNLYYNGTNTGESICNFVLAQNNSSKKIVKEKLYHAGSFEEYLSEFLAGFSAETDAQLDMLTNKSIKYLFYRYNESLISHGSDPAFIVHTKVSADEVVLESLQDRDWQYLVETVIDKAETYDGYFKIKTEKEPPLFKKMTKNYKVLRRLHNDLNALNPPRNAQSETELLGLFYYFYFINGRFTTTNEHTLVPRARSPPEVNGQELSFKQLYGKFANTNSRGIVSSQFLAALFLFFNGGDVEGKVCKFLSKLYQNMTVSRLSEDYSFQYYAYTDFLTSISFLFRKLGLTQIETAKTEDIDTDFKLKQKYEIDNLPPPPPPYDALHVFITDTESVSEKIKQTDVIVEP